MSDEDGAICGACCAIFCTTTLGAWCNLKAFGGGFDEDSWDKKDAEDRKKAQAAAGSSQPAPTPQMDAAATPANNPDLK